MWYLYTMEFYAAMKKNEIMPFAGKWMELENIMLSEISQTKQDKYHMPTAVTCSPQQKTLVNMTFPKASACPGSTRP
jgi:hypothetical protein